MYHMHIGLSTWAATEVALAEVHAGLAAHGYTRAIGSGWLSTGRWVCPKPSVTSR